MIKRIETKKDQIKKEKRLQLILAAILILVLFGSVFGIVVNSFGGSNFPTKIVTYNNYDFSVENGYYTIELGISKFYFSNNPNDVESLEKQVALSREVSSYTNKEVYVLTGDYSSYSEIVQNFNQHALRIQQACKLDEECVDKTLPLKTCENNLIIIKEAPENKIYEEKNCVYIEGKKEELLKLTDEFLLHEIGIK